MPTAIITGASTGLGRDFALICAQNGYDVVLVARDVQRLEALALQIRREFGSEGIVLAKDLSRPEAPVEVYNELTAANCQPKLLINNAGFGLLGHFAHLPVERQMEMIRVNIAALTELTRLFLPGMITRRSGRILNVASTAAFQPGPLMAVYFASKAYVVSFSRALHNELKGSGVTVTTLCPGPTQTEFANRAGMAQTKLFNRTMASETVARIGFKAMMAGKSIAIAGRQNALMAFLVRFVSPDFAASAARKLQESEGAKSS